MALLEPAAPGRPAAAAAGLSALAAPAPTSTLPAHIPPHIPTRQPPLPATLGPTGKPVTTNIFPFQYAFNLFSHNSPMTDNGYNEEEMKLVRRLEGLVLSRLSAYSWVLARRVVGAGACAAPPRPILPPLGNNQPTKSINRPTRRPHQVKETAKIWGDDSVAITGTCIRVPVMRAHAESINLEFEKDISGGCGGWVLRGAGGFFVGCCAVAGGCAVAACCRLCCGSAW